jgi:antitoxin (DNA-binding transcriptional repressor) of toxin-antitoxin stability system
MIVAKMPEAKTKLSRLVKAAQRGEEVFLKRNGVIVAQIVAIPKRKLPFGFLQDKVSDIPDSLLFGSSEEDLDEFARLCSAPLL